jgi:hypothetical protein
MYSWGTWGDFPGGFWGVHGMSVDPEGNFYVPRSTTAGRRNSAASRRQPGYLMGKPIRVAWK